MVTVKESFAGKLLVWIVTDWPLTTSVMLNVGIVVAEAGMINALSAINVINSEMTRFIVFLLYFPNPVVPPINPN